MSRNRSTHLAGLIGATLVLLGAGCHAVGRMPAALDPAAEARQLSARCAPQAPGAPEARAACLEALLVSRVEERGVEAAMESLRRLGELDAEIQREGHVYAHAIGIAAYTSPEQVGEIFGRCSPDFQSGCYHGVIQAYFLDLAAPQGQGREASAIDAEAVNALCEEQRSADGSGGRWLLFQCVHGLGHGLTMLYGHDLPRALEGCDLLHDDWERNSCYGGAFMENVVNATMPHHPAARHPAGAGPDEHAGHAAADAPPAQHDAHHGHHGDHGGHGGDHGESAFKALDPDDPHYPCSVLDRRYLSACYAMQTSAVLFHNQGDFAATARFCDEAPEEVRHTCYQSLGRDINSYAQQDHAATIRHCAVGDARYRSWCYVGVVKNLVDLTARAEDGLAYCRAVPEARGKPECYEAVGEQIWVLESEPARREELCRQAESGYLEHCRTGADLVSREAGRTSP